MLVLGREASIPTIGEMDRKSERKAQASEQEEKEGV